MRDLPWSLHATSAPLGHKGVSDAKQIRDAGGIKLLHICPATGNLPTRMTRAAWDVLCAAAQRKARERECIDKNQQYLMRMTKRLNVCAWCQGKTLPRGLEFIEAAEMAELSKPKEEAMAKQSKLDICENCGDKGTLTGSFGRQVCTTCLKIRSNVNSHLERVAKAAREMGKAEQLLTALVPDGGGLAIKVTADLLQEISGIVGYDGEDPAELVAAVIKATKACASCDAESVLHEIREIVDYSPDMGDSGLADAVRKVVTELVERAAKLSATGDFLCGELLRACGLEMDDTEDGEGWDVAAAAAIQEIAELTNRRDDLLALLTRERADNARLYEEKINRANAAFLHTVGEFKDEIVRLNNQTQSEPEQVTQLRDELTRTGADVEQLRDQLNGARELNVRLRDRLQTSESRLIWYREALRVLRDLVGLAHLDEDEDVMERILESIAAMTHALSRHQNLASAAEARAGHLEDELERQIGANEAPAAVERELRATIAEQSADFERLRNQDLAGNGRDWSTDDSPLLDVALAVIRDEPVPADRIATLIELARRASA